MREYRISTIVCLLAVLMVQPSGWAASTGPGPIHPTVLDDLQLQEMPAVDVQALLDEDAIDPGRGFPLRIGAASKTYLTPENSGSWQDLPGGGRIWRLRVGSQGALWLGLGLGVFQLEGQAQLRVYNPEQTQVLGPYSAEHNRPHGQLWLPLLAGSEAILELDWPAELAERAPRLALASVSHGYRPFEGLSLPERSDDGLEKASGACNIDVNCPLGADWQDEKRGVTRIVYTSGSSQFTCTGSLINNTARDCRNLYLTANHCLDSASEAASAVFYFNYERPSCGSGTANQTQTLSGSTLLATWAASDVTLLELDQTPPAEFGVYFNGWNRSTTAATESTCIHHPRGDPKKISYNSDPLISASPANANHWRVTEWEQGTTEGGSSGSPLFDQDSRIVGQLHQGTASCSNLNGWDEYGRLDISWTGGGSASTRLSDWLDPSGSGVMTLDGSDALSCGGSSPDLQYAAHRIVTPSGDMPLAADPGESVVVVVDVENQGAGDASAVEGTLSSSAALVTITDGSSQWPNILAGQTRGTDSPHFTLTLDPNYPCGQPVDLNLVMEASGAPLAGSSSFQLAVGSVLLDQVFEDAMESGTGGWISTELTGSNPWGLSTLFSSSPTHSWAVSAPAQVTDSVLRLEELSDLAPNASLEFVHRFDTETNADGGVLEYSTDGTSWQDAGSLITAGGYNATLSSLSGNPLGGRQAWSGLSSGWRTVEVDLSSFAGENLSLRWRHATDSSVAGVGWFIDDVEITASVVVCDNCPTLSNPGQQDFDGDGIGDLCESGARLADANNSARVDGFDLSLFGRSFGASTGQPAYDSRADLNRDGLVDGGDLSLMAPQFGSAVSGW